jgi:hypothetical protein
MNRGDRREATFADDADRERGLETLTETGAKTRWEVHAYCRMRLLANWSDAENTPNTAGQRHAIGGQRCCELVTIRCAKEHPSVRATQPAAR